MRSSLLLLLVAAPMYAAESTPPMPSLPPEPRVLQLTPRAGHSDLQAPAAVGPELSAEVQALQRALDRVRASLAGGGTVGNGAGEDPSPARPVAPAAAGELRLCPVFGEALSLQPVAGNGALISAALGPEAAERILKQLAALLGAGLDEVQPAALSRQVHLRLAAVPYPEALDRLLGQLGLRWREEGSGKARRLIIETSTSQADDLDRRARNALERVAAGVRGPAAAEAMWLMASQDAAAGRHAPALRGFSGLIEAYGASTDPSTWRWVQQASLGAGEAMLALGAYADARIAFRSWLARAEMTDPLGARVLLLSSQAARRLGADRQDAGAYDEAVDDLHRLLEHYADVPGAASEVAAARFGLGELLFTAGRQALGLPGGEANEVPPEAAARFRESEVQITRWLKSTGRNVQDAPDQSAFWLAECAFHLGRADEARPRFELLHRRWKSGSTDPQAEAGLYATAAFRAGECWLRREQPDHVRALFSFLRARQDFPQGDIAPYILVRIAQCYAELESEDQAVAALYQLLRDDQVNDSRPGRQQLDQLLGELVSRLGRYPGPVRARVLFYIARAQWLAARRDRAEQAPLAKQAAATYRRVLDEQPSPELRHASMLGLARSLLLSGDDARGEAELRRFLRDPTIGARDREYAAQLLGEHLRAQGRLREAIQAFRGEVSE
jgi:tetratricopeptide (TPR) repeat protein